MGILIKPDKIPGSRAIFNPAAIQERNGTIHLFCRVEDQNRCSEIRRVTLDSNLMIKDIAAQPILAPNGPWENRGREDPRILTMAGGLYLLTYTAAQANGRDCYTRIGLASSCDLLEFKRGSILTDLGYNKNGVLLDKRIQDTYWLYHRRTYPNIWTACSQDLHSWHSFQEVMTIRPDSWDCHHIGMGIVLPDDNGWLAFYHGADDANVYRIGAALFDGENPAKLIARSREPILEPKKVYERNGLVPNVVFTCGAIAINDHIIIFYGAADTCVAAAEYTRRELYNLLKPIPSPPLQRKRGFLSQIVLQLLRLFVLF